jgi:hypothetical protein
MPKFEIPDTLWEIEIERSRNNRLDPNYGWALYVWDARLKFCDQVLEHFSVTEGDPVPGTSWERFESEEDVILYAKRRFFQKMTSLWPREN